MPMLNFHPAPGLGDLLPGFTLLPFNPMTGGPGTPMVASLGAAFPGQPVRIPRIGDLLQNTQFTVPQNPIRDAMMGMGGLGCASCDGMRGLGGISDSVAAWIVAPSPISAVSNFVFYGGLAAAASYYFFFRHHR